MMALLAGSQLASHLLQLTEGSDRLLPEVFPRVEHIGRFNLTSEVARQILKDADAHLGAMSVPYALSLHEDYLKTCLGFLETAGKCSAGTHKIRLADQHAEIERATGGTFSAESLVQITTLRRMRNCTIHRGGRANDILVNDVACWPATVETAWVKVTRRSPRGLACGDRIVLGQGELVLALAVTKRLAREANRMLQQALPRPQWADVLVDDLLEMDPNVLRAPDRQRRVEGLARFHYAPLALTGIELQAALARR